MSFITNTSSFFINEKALFGAFPTQQQIEILEMWGVDLIVDLTNSAENKIKPYTTKCPVIKFTIPDRRVPEDKVLFCSLVVLLVDLICSDKKIYIHCKGGHGRASLLVSVLLCYMNKISPEESFNITSKYHAERPLHSARPKKNEYWKNKGFPQNFSQRDFVEMCFKSYKIPKYSPFQQTNIWLTKNYDDFLINTGLGTISGSNGKNIENYRNNLYREIGIKHFQYEVKNILTKEKECF